MNGVKFILLFWWVFGGALGLGCLALYSAYEMSILGLILSFILTPAYAVISDFLNKRLGSNHKEYCFDTHKDYVPIKYKVSAANEFSRI